MKILELFSGYGTASFALKRLGIKHELIGYSDIDKYANKCFQQNHGGKELGDVRKINPNELEDFDLLTGGFPCQAFSNAGKMQGEADPRGTLFYEIIRIAEVKKPKYMLLENVKGLTCKKFKDTFNKILSELDRIGYNVYWKVLNSKDYGIPQSRARVWFVCFRKPECCGKVMIVNKEIDECQCLTCGNIHPLGYSFEWPKPRELKIFIKDILEPQVDSKYYLSPLLQERFAKYLEEKESKIVAMRQRDRHGLNEKKGQQLEPREDGCSNTLTSVQKDNLVIEGYLGERFGSCNTVLSPESMSQTLSASMGLGGGYVPKIYDRKGFDSRTKGFRESELSPTLSTKMGTGGNNVPMVMNTITTAVGRRGHSKEELSWIDTNRQAGQLRRLTPKECFRLMGFLNDEINLDGLSDTQKYRLAGNGQDVNMVSLIFKEMFNGNNLETK